MPNKKKPKPSKSTSSQSLDALIQKAVGLHQTGQITQAATLYRQILKITPNDPHILHLSGVAAYQQQHYSQAEKWLQKAIGLNNDIADFYMHLGLVFHAQQKYDKAIQTYQKALQFQPNVAEIYNNLAASLRATQQLDAAVQCYQQAVQLNPNYVDTHYNLATTLELQEQWQSAIQVYHQVVTLNSQHVNAWHRLGNILRQQQQFNEAIQCYQNVLKLTPNSPEVYNNLGLIYQTQNQLKLAQQHLQHAIQLNPKFAEPYNNLGSVLKAQAHFEQATAHFQQAIQLKPNYVEAYYNLGNVNAAQMNYEQAIHCYQQAIKVDKPYAPAYHNMGVMYDKQNQMEAAINSYQQALQYQPDAAETHFDYAVALLKQGEFLEGWSEYEWRFKLGKGNYPFLPKPRWQGENLQNKRLLIHWEQGFGDTIQFARYLSLINTDRVLFACPQILAPLFEKMSNVEIIIADHMEQTLSIDYDVWLPLLSLPHVLQTTLDTIPAQVAYISANSKKAVFWQAHLPQTGFKIGIVWAGRATHENDQNRSCPITYFLALAQLPNVHLFSLQKDNNQALPADLPLTLLNEHLHDFSDTAAIIANLDLVISVDTAVAHLASAMNCPTWLLLPYAAEWRWLVDRNDSPWYPNMRLFRQTQIGDWQGVFEQVIEQIS